MVRKEQVDMLCLQETKKAVIDKALCQVLWGDAEIRWEMQPRIQGWSFSKWKRLKRGPMDT